MNLAHNLNDESLNETGIWMCPKEIVEAIRAQNLKKVIEYSKSHFSYDENKFWGRYYNLYESQDLVNDPSNVIQGLAPIRKEKILIINPKTELITQVHRHKAEAWYALTDNVSYYSGDGVGNLKHRSIAKNEIVSIPSGLLHKLVNISDTPAVVYEIQTGFCHEEDVERFS